MARMKVCVVGAGPSGLTTVKQLLDEGHEVTCFEKGSSVGGIWYRHANDANEMKAFDNLILTISIKLMSFSDFMLEDRRVFYTRQQYFEYLKLYADNFCLNEHIRLNTAVSHINKDTQNQWHVKVSSNGTEVEHVFDAVAICSGPFQTPNMDVTDIEKFGGEIIHSSRYRNNAGFRGKRVMVVGLAESGADILREVSDVSESCTLAIRTRSFLIPRVHGDSSTDSSTCRSNDYEMYVRSTRRTYPMKAFFGQGPISRLIFFGASAVFGLLSGLWAALHTLIQQLKGVTPSLPDRNNLGEPMYPLKLDLGTEWTKENVDAINDWNSRSQNGEATWQQKIIFSKNVSFIPNIVRGKVKIVETGIKSIVDKRVTFKDGTSAEFDAIVLCTGFIKNFAALGQDVGVKDNNVRNLYKHCFHPAHDGRLAFMGFVRPFQGGIPICAEMQARYFALLCSNKAKLPEKLDAVIQVEKSWEEYQTSFSPRHTESIPSQVMFLDAIAKEIGCLMPMWRLLLNPGLLVRQWFYPFNQACYRLVGPHNQYESAHARIMREKPDGHAPVFLVLIATLFRLLPWFVHPKHPLISPPTPKILRMLGQQADGSGAIRDTGMTRMKS